MTFRLFLVAGLAVIAAACTEKEPAAPSAPAGTQEAAVDQATADGAVDGDDANDDVIDETLGSDAFIRHMHQHSKQLKRLNDALAVGDLESAQLPAFWLSRHEGIRGPVEQWLPHLKKVRDAARAVEEATDLDTARSAARQIAVGCRGCHESAGVDADLSAAL